MHDEVHKQQRVALARYQVISAYLAMAPKRGQRGLLLRQLAARTWTDADGEPLQVAAETIRNWVRRYRRRGLAGLEDKERPKRGIQALSAEQVEQLCALKREVPERSLDRIIRIAEETELVPRGEVRRSTLHRALQAHGLSARACRTPDRQDLDRFEADAPNDLWQSDMLVGPWLPNPKVPGKVRRAYLYAFLDDHSRLLLHGRFGFKGDLPALELVFRRALQKYGLCRRVYYDNGQTYRSHHMKHIVATLGLHRVIYTQSYRPMGHGKIEKFNQRVRSGFLAELQASNISTLDELNEAFLAWGDLEYNRTPHAGVNDELPLDRWRAGVESVRYADDEALRQAFLWREDRTPDKTAILKLFGTEYGVGPELARRKVELRYDPERLEEIEVWRDGRFVQRARPYQVQANRRPKAAPAVEEAPKPAAKPAASADWLGHLVGRRRKEGFVEPAPRQLHKEAVERRAAQDNAVLALLTERLDDGAYDEAIARRHLQQCGPYDAPIAAEVLDRFCAEGRTGLHVSVYLDAIREASQGETRR